jgi:hypothetical protein
MATYKVTNFAECIEVFVAEHAIFGTKKSGYARLVKDDHKRAYCLQLYLITDKVRTEGGRARFDEPV